MTICKPPTWEEYKNPDTLIPWKLNQDLIYLIKNTPQDDYLLLSIIDEPYPREYDDDEYPQGDNNENSQKMMVRAVHQEYKNKIE